MFLQRQIGWGALIAALMLIIFCGFSQADSIKGILTLDGRQIALTYVEGFFDPKADSIVLFFASAPPGRPVSKIWELRHMEAGRKGAVVVEFNNVSKKKLDMAAVSLDLNHESLQDGYLNEGLGTNSYDMTVKEFKAVKGGVLKGSFIRKSNTAFGHTWSADIQYFEVTLK